MLCVYVIRAIEIHIDGTSLERARISIEISVIHRYYCPVDGRVRDTHTLRFCINPSPPVSLNCVFLYLFFYILVAEIILPFRSLSEYFILFQYCFVQLFLRNLGIFANNLVLILNDKKEVVDRY